MNTKILFLTIALSLGFPYSVSTGAVNQKHLIAVEIPMNHKTESNSRADSRPVNFPFDQYYDSFTHHTGQSEEEQHSHHFHYDRLYKIRKRILWIIFVKTFLLIMHVSSFLYFTMHIFY